MYKAESAHLYLHLLQLAEGQHQHLQLLRLKFFFILNTDQVDRIQGWLVVWQVGMWRVKEVKGRDVHV